MFVENIFKKFKNKNYNSVLIFNGFTQKIPIEYLLRPKNPKNFYQNL